MTTISSPATVPGATTTLRLGTRRSALALTQSRLVAAGVEAAAALTGRPVRVELVEVTTAGDVSRAPVASFGGTGVFVSALREALLAGQVDLAVHSLKDLPTAPAPGLELAAVPLREDPRDALVARDGLTLRTLPAGARIGTGSPRRAAQLRAYALGHGQELDVVDLRGNVDTRVGRVRDGSLDAVVVAMAGLRRLGREDEVSQVLPAELMLPAPGQGALAVECREGDAGVLAALAPLDHWPSRAAAAAERALLATLEAGCTAPLGALAVLSDSGDELSLRCVVAAPDGSRRLYREAVAAAADDPEDLGRRLAADLLEAGAAELVAAAQRGSAAEPRKNSQAGEGDL